jgi:molybdopterin-guanine dinucleotide biosynthesis protein B
VAVATDTPLPGIGLPLLDLNDIAAIADFIVDRCGLERR